jgi:hypothetical protein
VNNVKAIIAETNDTRLAVSLFLNIFSDNEEIANKIQPTTNNSITLIFYLYNKFTNQIQVQQRKLSQVFTTFKADCEQGYLRSVFNTT